MDQILLKGDLPELSLSTRVEKEDLMCPSNGLNNSKLKKASAGTSDVLSGKTFYAGDKNLKTGSFNLGAANAGTSDVLSGKTFYAGDKSLKTGTFNLGSANANPWEVLEGKTFYSNNNKSLQYGTVKNAKNASSIRLDSQNDIPLFYGINSGFHQNTDGGYRFCIWTNMNNGRVYVDGSNTWICVSTDYLEDKSGWQYVIAPGGSVTIPKGYHDGTHSVYSKRAMLAAWKISWGPDVNRTEDVNVGKNIEWMPTGDIFRLDYMGTYLKVNRYSGTVFNYTVLGSSMTGSVLVPYLYYE